MAAKFDISEHIKVEALGIREGNVIGSSLWVGGNEYPVANYTTSPVTNPIVDVAIQDKYDTVAITWGTSVNDWTDGTFQYPVTHTSGTVTYELWYIERNDDSFDWTEDPASSGVMHSTWTSGTGTVKTRNLGTFNPSTKWYMFASYYVINGVKTLTGKNVASRYIPTDYTYSFTGSIGSMSSTNMWHALGYTSDLVAIRSSRTTYIVPRDPNNGNMSRNYKIYFNDVYVATFTLSTPDEYWNPDPSSLATWVWNVGTNTLKVFLEADDPQTATPRMQLTTVFGYTNPHRYPTYAEPIKVFRSTSTSAILRWDYDESHVGQSQFPSSTAVDTYIDVFGSDGSSTFYRNVIADLDHIPVYSSGDRVWQSVLPGLNMDTTSYLIKVYYINEPGTDKILWHTATYGVNPPSAEFIGEPVVASGWWPVECSVSNVDITKGYNNDKGLLKTPEPGKCSITMKGNEGDPRVNTAIQLDNKVRILLDAAASPNATDEYLFSGFIESMATTYDPFGNAITDLELVDAMSRVLNVNIELYDIANEESFSTRMANVFTNYIAPNTWGVSYDTSVWPLLQPYDGSVFPPEYRENVSASEIINELTEGEYAVMGCSRAGVIFWFNRAAPAIFLDSSLTSQPPYYGFSTEHSTSLDHFCISNFTIRNSIEDITNRIVATLSYDELTTSAYEDATSIAKYGVRSYDVSLNLFAPDGNQTQYLDSWLAEVPYFEDQSELESVSTNVVNRNGYVTKAYQYDPLLDPIRVYLKTGPVDVNGVWYAREVNHSITPDGWIMSVNLTAD